MRDLVTKPDGKDDKGGMRDVLFWLRDTGAEIESARVQPPADGPDDEAVVDIIEDIADAIVDAVNAVVDAISQVGRGVRQRAARHRQLDRRRHRPPGLGAARGGRHRR